MSCADAAATRPPPSAARSAPSARFGFRFVTRGEQAGALTLLAVKSLKRCHPQAGVTLVDANDNPTLDSSAVDFGRDVAIVHVRPGEDDVARAVGRGSRRHLFYWRHSPEVLGALPPSDRFHVYAGCDIVFLRPLDLASLLGPLERGRIAAAIDESSLEHYEKLPALAAGPAGTILPAAGSGGPLLQGGLLFTNPADDGGLYPRFWKCAVDAARAGFLARLPSDDMCILTALLGHGGPMGERLLALGHEWNYVTDQQKDPGIFGCAAHYGGHRAKALILGQQDRLFPPGDGADPLLCWGTVAAGGPAATGLVRGSWRWGEICIRNSGPKPRRGSTAVPLPFALSWLVSDGADRFRVSAAPARGDPPSDELALFVYEDGRLVRRLASRGGRVAATLRLAPSETVTLIGVSSSGASHVYLADPFARDP